MKTNLLRILPFYSAPTVEVIELSVEQPVFVSSLENPFEDDEMDW